MVFVHRRLGSRAARESVHAWLCRARALGDQRRECALARARDSKTRAQALSNARQSAAGKRQLASVRRSAGGDISRISTYRSGQRVPTRAMADAIEGIEMQR